MRRFTLVIVLLAVVTAYLIDLRLVHHHNNSSKIDRNTTNRNTTMTTPASKRGLCWPSDNKDPVHTFTKPGSKITWLYNWSPTPTANSTSLSWVPMQWNGADIDNLSTKLTNSNTRIDSILAFNEPELPDQANMTASAAAEAWLRCIEPLRKQRIRCGSPGISSAPQGVPWLQEFTALIRAGGSDVDFWALHWYGEGLGGLYDYIWSTHARLGNDKPVWITEFACTNWSVERPIERAKVVEFARESCKYLDSLDWVERYAWFGAMRDAGTVGEGARMLDSDGQLTELGRAYRDA